MHAYGGAVSGGGEGERMSLYTDEFGPNVQNILAAATRVIRGRIPSSVRKELSAAVKAGALGHLKKDGLRPEIFYHPDHRNGAIERQKREAEYAQRCIAGVMADPANVRADLEARGIDVVAHVMSGQAFLDDSATEDSSDTRL